MKYILFLNLLSILLGCSNTSDSSLKTGLEGKTIPVFNMLLMDSSHQMNTGKIPAGKPVVFLLVSPFCPYCRALTKDIVDHMQSLDGIQFYVISSFPLDQIRGYYGEFKLDNYPNITVGQDYATVFQNYFKASAVPYVAIYGEEKKLRKVFVGKININLIKETAFN